MNNPWKFEQNQLKKKPDIVSIGYLVTGALLSLFLSIGLSIEKVKFNSRVVKLNFFKPFYI